MNKLDSQPAPLTLSPALRLETARWLIVLVPNVEADLAAATRRVWELANAGDGRVRFIGLYENTVQELILRRQLVNMSAMVGNGGRIYAETELVFGRDWVEVVRSRWQAGDMVMCFSEQRIGPLNRPLSQVLQSNLDVPVYILSGLDPQNDLRSSWPAPIAAWAGSIAIIFGFFVLQVRIDHLATGPVHIILLLLCIPVEVWMIWAWNSLFGQ
jgi:hypothetical protein